MPDLLQSRASGQAKRLMLLCAVALVEAAGCSDGGTAASDCPPPCRDVNPPSAPTGIAAGLAGPMSIELSWNASTDDVGVTGYEVCPTDNVTCDGVTTTSYIWNATLPRTRYCFYVTAHDMWNSSPPSETACVTTGSPPPHVDEPDLGITCSIAFDDAGTRHVSAAWQAGRLVDGDMSSNGAASGISTTGGSSPRLQACYVGASLLPVIVYEAFDPYQRELVAGAGGDLLFATRCAIAVGDNGEPTVVYDGGSCNSAGTCREELALAYRSGGTWYSGTVETGPMRFPSVAVSFGGACVAYYDSANGDLKFACMPGPPPAIIDEAGDVGAYTALAVDASARFHVSYYDANLGHLKYASQDGGSWSIETVDSDGNVGSYTSLALDSAGMAHIGYFDETNGTLKYATNASGSWKTAAIGAGATLGYATSTALDHDGKVHVLWIDYTYPDAGMALRHATNATGAWVAEKLRSL